MRDRTSPATDTPLAFARLHDGGPPVRGRKDLDGREGDEIIRVPPRGELSHKSKAEHQADLAAAFAASKERSEAEERVRALKLSSDGLSADERNRRVRLREMQAEQFRAFSSR